MTDPAKIAAGLSEAQRRALVSMPADTPFMPREYSRQLPTVACLQAKRLIRPVGDPDFVGPWSENIVTRPLGQAVRAHLIEGEKK